MATDNVVDSWLRLFSPTIKFPDSLKLPGSGSFGSFNFQPYTKWEAPSLLRGDDTVEQRIYSEVASPGKQLGRLTDLVLHLATAVADLEAKIDGTEPTERQKEKTLAFAALKEIADDIEKIKLSNTESAKRAVNKDLDRLAKADKELCKELLQEYLKKLE